MKSVFVPCSHARKMGGGPSENDLLSALITNGQVSVTKVTAEQIRSGGLAGLDILIHPGGSGGQQGGIIRSFDRLAIPF